jgi:hypothetical protein
MVEPGPRVPRAFCREAEQIVDRPLQPKRRRMRERHARKRTVAAFEADDRDLIRLAREHRHVHGVRFAPETEQCRLASDEVTDRRLPSLLTHDRARPRMVVGKPVAMRNAVEQAHGIYPNSRATFWKPKTSAGGR